MVASNEQRLTPAEIATILNVGQKKVWELIGSGSLQAENISPGRRRATWRISRAALSDFLERQQRVPQYEALRRHSRRRSDDRVIQFR